MDGPEENRQAYAGETLKQPFTKRKRVSIQEVANGYIVTKDHYGLLGHDETVNGVHIAGTVEVALMIAGDLMAK